MASRASLDKEHSSQHQPQNVRVENTSPAGNRTPVSRVTGGDTYHYTTEDVVATVSQLSLSATLCSAKFARKNSVENPGIDPGTSRMQSERSTM